MREELNGLWGPGPNRPVGAAGGGGPGGVTQGPDPEPHHAQQPELDSGVEPEAEGKPRGDPRDWEPDPMPPNLVARPRGTLAKKPEGPKMPLSPQQTGEPGR